MTTTPWHTSPMFLWLSRFFTTLCTLVKWKFKKINLDLCPCIFLVRMPTDNAAELWSLIYEWKSNTLFEVGKFRERILCPKTNFHFLLARLEFVCVLSDFDRGWNKCLIIGTTFGNSGVIVNMCRYGWFNLHRANDNGIVSMQGGGKSIFTMKMRSFVISGRGKKNVGGLIDIDEIFYCSWGWGSYPFMDVHDRVSACRNSLIRFDN